MKKFILLVVAGFCAIALAAQEKPAPAMPAEVTLTTGRVLRNVQVIRWESNRVVLKHAAGADPIAFALFKVPAQSELPAIRVSFEAAKKIETIRQQNEATPAKDAPKKYEGQAFIVTRGAGNYKLGGMTVLVYLAPAVDIREKYKWESTAPKPDAIATTDADGKFSFTTSPSGPVTLVAKAKRLAGSTTERYFWVVDCSTGANRFEPRLSNDNKEPEPHLESGAYNSL